MQLANRLGIRELWENKKLSGLFLLLAAVYAAQSFLLPADQETLDKYDISQTQLVILLLTIILPYMLIWLIALRGYLGLRAYTATIARAKDGQAFAGISKGLLVLALWMPLSALVGAATSYYAREQQDLAPAMTMINNYFNMLWLLLGFYLLYRFSGKLISLARRAEARLPGWVVFAYTAVAVLYTFLVLQDPARTAATDSVEQATYYLPDWLIVTTVIIPRLLVWLLGIQAVYNVITYRMKVKGSIYKEALADLAKGIGWVVVAIVALRCFQSLSSPLSEFSLAALLLVIYALLVIISIGYVFIYKGAKKLKRIEEL